MGHTIVKLSKKDLNAKNIFNNRFCVEICEKMHTHYRNLRIVQTLDDFITMAEGFSQALDRWKKRGCPGTGDRHIELVRKKIAITDTSNHVEVNLNDNLYLQNEGQIFAEGAEFKDPKYIHVKIRDLRLEMSIDEFNTIAECFNEAKKRLEDSNLHEPLLTP